MKAKTETENYRAAVVRAAYLADDLDREAAELRRNAPGLADGIADLKSITADRIRAALKSAKREEAGRES